MRRVDGRWVAALLGAVAGAAAGSGACTSFGAGPALADDAGAVDGAVIDSAVTADAADADTSNEGVDTPGLACDDPACVAGADCIDGQCPEVFATVPKASGVALFANEVFITTYSRQLLRKPKNATDHGAAAQAQLAPGSDGTWQYLNRSGNVLLWTRKASDAPSVLHIPIGALPMGAVVSEQPYVEDALAVLQVRSGLIYVSSYSAGKVFELDGGAGAAPIGDFDNEIEGLVADNDEVFAAHVRPGEIVRVVPPGGPTHSVGGLPAGLALQGGRFYFTDQSDDSVASIPRIGGDRTMLARAANTSPMAIAVDDTHVYWTVKDRVLRVRHR
jgi:hypothetical protein